MIFWVDGKSLGAKRWHSLEHCSRSLGNISQRCLIEVVLVTKGNEYSNHAGFL
jgi:hypothetical protein